MTMTDKPISKMTKAELDALYASDAHEEIEGWDEMTVAAKRKALQAMEDDAEAAGPNPAEEDADLPGEPAPAGRVRIKVTAASCNPVPVFVHGVGHFEFRIGETSKPVPAEIAEALTNSDVTFETL